MNYGKHYTKNQVAELFSPSADSVEIVKNWLFEAGIPASQIVSTKSKGWLQFKTTVGQLEEILQTSYHFYENERTKREYLGASGYTLPRAVSEHVDFITPGVAMLKKRTSSSFRGPARPFEAISSPGMVLRILSAPLIRGCRGAKLTRKQTLPRAATPR